MKPALLLFCALSTGFFSGCSGDKPQELIDTAQFEEQQHNLPHAKLLMANYVNIRDLLGYDKLVMPLKALE